MTITNVRPAPGADPEQEQAERKRAVEELCILRERLAAMRDHLEQAATMATATEIGLDTLFKQHLEDDGESAPSGFNNDSWDDLETVQRAYRDISHRVELYLADVESRLAAFGVPSPAAQQNG